MINSTIGVVPVFIILRVSQSYTDPELTPKIFIDMLDNVIVVNGGDYIYRTDKCDGFYISKAEVFEENFCIDGSRD